MGVTRRIERQRLFTDMHDRLASKDSQRGRRLLFNRMKNDPNRGIGLHNALGIYAHRGSVDRQIALDHRSGRV